MRYRYSPNFLLLVVTLAVLGIIQLPSVVHAQGGQFLDNLFRSIAEDNLLSGRDGRLPQSIPNLPTRRNPAVSNVPIGNIDPTLSRFDQQLQVVRQRFDDQLRRGGSDSNALRLLLPELYETQAQSQALLQRAQMRDSPDQYLPIVMDLDRRWRNLSFRLRSNSAPQSDLREAILVGDSICRDLERRYRISPQYDAVALRDQMVVAATYMQCLIDDLSTSRSTLGNSGSLTLRGRRLRQALMDEAARVRGDNYDEITSRLTDYVMAWRPFAQNVASLNNPLLNQRLIRIEQTADEAYALLWMTPPGSPSFSDDRFNPNDRPFINARLIEDIASLDHIADYFAADVQRMRNWVRSRSLGDRWANSAQQFQQRVRQIHRLVDDRSINTNTMVQSVEQMTSAWMQLDRDFQQVVQQGGLSSRRLASIESQVRQMQPLVGHLSATYRR
ncbi:MAG: hypothetical protein AAF539_15445 [Planctomycetota bacterium]